MLSLTSRSFFFNDTATTEIYTSFPTRRSSDLFGGDGGDRPRDLPRRPAPAGLHAQGGGTVPGQPAHPRPRDHRSEEHTSELQSRQYLVCRLLLEKKNTSYTAVSFK